MDNKKVISNLFWRFMERVGAQGVTFIVSIILARLLDPNVYGIIALVTVFTAILQVFVDSGLGTALIQKKEVDDVDYSSVFYVNIFICIVLYCGMFFSAPFISKFYGIEELTPVIRVMSLTIVVAGIKNVQQAYVARNLMFKKFFLSTLGGTIGAAIIGIVLALLGFGVWALVAQYLFNITVDTIILWLTVEWRPICAFSLDRLKSLYSFGWKIFVASLLETFYQQLRSLVIGKMYTTSDLAFYNKGKQFPDLIATNINISIDSVLLPTMSQQQDNITRLKDMTRRAIKTGSYVMMPMLVGLAMCAEPFIKLLLTEKWLPCVPFMRVFCLIYIFYPINTANLNAIRAMGRSDLTLKLGIIKKIIGLAALLGTLKIGVMAIAYGELIANLLCQFVNAWPNKKLLKYSYHEQMKDILPYLFMSCSMGAIVYAISFLQINNYAVLFLQITAGIIFYIVLSIVLKVDSFIYVRDSLLNYLKKDDK